MEGAANPDLAQVQNHTQRDSGQSQSHPQIKRSYSTTEEIEGFVNNLLLGIEDKKKQPGKKNMIDELLDRIGRKIIQFK